MTPADKLAALRAMYDAGSNAPVSGLACFPALLDVAEAAYEFRECAQEWLTILGTDAWSPAYQRMDKARDRVFRSIARLGDEQ